MNRCLLVALLGLLLAGCATRTIESRTKERRAAFDALSDTQRTNVSAGKIAIGMPMDAVYIAWGSPYQIVNSESPAGAFTSWLYYGTYLQGVTYWGHPGYYSPYRHYYYPGPALMSG